MKINYTFLILGLILFNSSCKKDIAPYIDSVVGTYKVNGSIDYDTITVRNVIDSIITITKVDDETIGFIIGECDTSFSNITLHYDALAGSVRYVNFGVGHSPNSAYVFFPSPPDGSFSFYGNLYCGNHFAGTELYGTKMP